MKALVTGGTGFIGSHLAEALLQRGVQVRCLVRKGSDLKWLKGLSVEIITGDCSDKASLREAVKEIDEIFHLAGITKAVKEKTYFEVNAFGTENLIHACLENSPRIRKFIYLSSRDAEARVGMAIKRKNSDRCEPISAYGQSKRRGEELALVHAHENVPSLFYGLPGFYGPRDKDFYMLLQMDLQKNQTVLQRESQSLLCPRCYPSHSVGR